MTSDSLIWPSFVSLVDAHSITRPSRTDASADFPGNRTVGLEAGVIAALSGRDEEARRSFESVLLVAPQSTEATRARTYLEQLAS